MRILGSLAFAAVMVVGSPVCGAGDSGSAPPLIVVGDFANPPFSSWSVKHTPVGIEVEILDLVGRELGRPVEWRELPFAEMLPAVAQGQAHVAASTIGVTAARAERVRFTESYYETELCVVVAAADGPRSFEALSGRRVGAGRATTSEEAVRRGLAQATLVVEREGELTFGEMLLAGKLAAIVMDRPAAERLVSENPGRMSILEQHLGVERYAFAVTPAETEIVAAIDAVLARAREDGLFERWAARVAGQPGTTLPSLGIPNELRPIAGVLSGGQPDAEQLSRAAEAGFKTVINLRGPGEKGELAGEAEHVQKLGMRYVAIPVATSEAIDLVNATRLREALGRPDAMPVLLHCASGNRIGALFALAAFHLDGRSVDAAIEVGRGAGMTRAEPLVRKRLEASPE